MEQGIGALTSDAGRAAQVKASQMQKGGASLDQVQQELYGSVMKGLLPFQVAAELFQQLKSPPKEPAAPPTGTVVNDMAQMLAKRSSGVASLPAPDMDQAQFAGGGIVAFAGGNLVPSGGRVPALSGRINLPSTAAPLTARALPVASGAGRWMIGKGPLLTIAGLGLSALPYFFGDDDKVEAEPEEASKPSRQYEVPADSGTPQAAMPSMNISHSASDTEIARMRKELAGMKPQDRDAYIAEQRQMLEDSGVGKVTAQREAALAKREREYEQEKGKAGLMSLARAGFEMAANASQPGATFFGAAASGALQGLQQYGAEKERLRQVDAGIQDAQFQLAEAGAMREYAARQGGDALYREAQKTYNDRSAGLAALVINREESINRVKIAEFQVKAQTAIANAELLAKAGEMNLARQISGLVAMSNKFWAKGDTATANDYMDRVQAIVDSTSPQVRGKQVGAPNMAGAGVDADQWGGQVTTTAPKSED